MARSSRHWYVRNSEGGLDEAHSLGIKDARKAGAFISPTTVIHEVRAVPFHLNRWQRQQLVLACTDFPKHPQEDPESYYDRVNNLSFRRTDEAAAFGVRVHAVAQHYPAQQLDPFLEPWYIELRAWFAKNVKEDLTQEERIGDINIGVAGTLDRTVVRLIDDDIAVLDWKTQGIKDRVYYGESWPKQLGFYANAKRKQLSLPRNPRCINIVIDSTAPNPCITKEWSHEEINEAYKDFLAEVWLWSRDNRHWPVGQWNLAETLLNPYLCPP